MLSDKPLRAASRTHAGRVRPDNEDAPLCLPERGLFAVIDGMGGEAGGEIAARLTVEALSRIGNRRKQDSALLLTQAFEEARARILDHAKQDPSHRGLGAVATAARLDDDGRTLTLAHAGDCRALLLAGERLQRLTNDHTEEQPGRAKGAVSRDLGRAELPPQWVDVRRVPVNAGDLLLLCSDGLHGVIPEEEVRAALIGAQREQLPVEDLCARLVALALAKGGPDNVTVVAVRIGRFSRRRLPRLGVAFSGGLLLLLLCLVGFVLNGFRAARPTGRLPAEVSGIHNPGGPLPSPLQPAADGLTVVPAGSRLILHGNRLQGDRLVLKVEGEAVLEFCAIEMKERLEIKVSGALTLRDCRLESPEIALIAAPGAQIRLERSWAVTGRAEISPRELWPSVVFLNDISIKDISISDISAAGLRMIAPAEAPAAPAGASLNGAGPTDVQPAPGSVPASPPAPPSPKAP